MLLAEGPEKGIQAEQVDDEISALAGIARIAWPELLGRAAALQLTVDKVTLLENLMGKELPQARSPPRAALTGARRTSAPATARHEQGSGRGRTAASYPKGGQAYATHQARRSGCIGGSRADPGAAWLP